MMKEDDMIDVWLYFSFMEAYAYWYVEIAFFNKEMVNFDIATCKKCGRASVSDTIGYENSFPSFSWQYA